MRGNFDGTDKGSKKYTARPCLMHAKGQDMLDPNRFERPGLTLGNEFVLCCKTMVSTQLNCEVAPRRSPLVYASPGACGECPGWLKLCRADLTRYKRCQHPLIYLLVSL